MRGLILVVLAGCAGPAVSREAYAPTARTVAPRARPPAPAGRARLEIPAEFADELEWDPAAFENVPVLFEPEASPWEALSPGPASPATNPRPLRLGGRRARTPRPFRTSGIRMTVTKAHGHAIGRPGQATSRPGQPFSAPDHPLSKPGPSVKTPGQAVATPGSAVSTPGQAVATPGQAVSTPGQAVSTPGQAVKKPGQAVKPPGPAVERGSHPVRGSGASATKQKRPDDDD